MLSHVQLFCSLMDYTLPGSSVHGIFQARILEWVAISFRGSSRPSDRTHVSWIGRWILYQLHHLGSLYSDTHESLHSFCKNYLRIYNGARQASLVGQMVKNLPAMLETWVWSLGWKDPLEKEVATHSSILAWRIPGSGESGNLQLMRSQRVRHNWATKTQTLTYRGPELIKVIGTQE